MPHRYCDNHFLRDVAKPVLGGRQPRQGSDAEERFAACGKSNKQCLSNTPHETSKSVAEDDPEPTVTAVARPSEHIFSCRGSPETPRVPWCSSIARRCVVFSTTIREDHYILPACR